MTKYSIQEHKATKLHWDLRLEHRGTLKSWAITKVPPRKKGLKRLAIATPNHDLNYWDFEGEIPEGQYGAGTVKIWDKGSHEPVKWKTNEIIVNLKGKKLKGEYCLIKFITREGKKAWLFFKR